jgi:hypothetical protein
MVARRLTGLTFVYDNEAGDWIRPTLSRQSLLQVGLNPLIDYIKGRREYILPYARSLPVFNYLRDTPRTSETSRKLFYTNDPDLADLARRLGNQEARRVAMTG